MLREVSMRMFWSLAERKNLLREEKWAPDVSNGFPTAMLGFLTGTRCQDGVSILKTIILSSTLYRITRVRNIAQRWNFDTLFIYYSSTLSQFLDLIYWKISDFIFYLRDTCVTCKPRIGTNAVLHMWNTAFNQGRRLTRASPLAFQRLRFYII